MFLLSLFVYKSFLRNECEALSCLVFPNKDIWKIEEVYDNQKYSWKGLIALPTYKIRIYKVGNIDREKASNFTQIAEMTTMGLFDTAKSPYAGEISDKIVCPENLRPTNEVFTNKFGLDIHYMKAFLNTRLQYGACIENQVSKKVFSGIFYCNNTSEWYQIEMFIPVTENTNEEIFKDLLNNATCQER